MQISRKDFFVDNVRDGSYCGIVVDIEDPLKIGRVRIEVFGFFDGLEPNLIPWATPATSNTGGSNSGGGFFSVPKLGSVVEVKFDSGNIYNPQYSFNQRISNELKDEISGSYTNAHSLIYDTVTEEFVKVYFTEEKGLMLDYKESQINIKPDKSIIIQNASRDGIFEMLDDGTMNITQANNINIKTDANINIECVDANVKCSNIFVDHASSIELGKGATEHLVLGDTFMKLFNKHTHTGNLGVPTAPPIQKMTPGELSQKEVKTL